MIAAERPPIRRLLIGKHPAPVNCFRLYCPEHGFSRTSRPDELHAVAEGLARVVHGS